VLVEDNQLVKAGDPLVELDQGDQQVRIDQIRAQLAQTDEQVRQIDEQRKQSVAESLAARALVARAGAQLRRHEAEAKRVQALFDSQAMSVSKSELDNALASRDSTLAELRAQEYQTQAAQAKNGSTGAARAVALAQRKVLEAQLRDAELQLQYTRILAPVAGRVGKRNVEVGTRVQAGQHLLAVVQHGVWINANFKETQLGGLHPGQHARITIDAFSGVEFTGRIDSISPAAGAQFALLPPDNATGNFTRIAQRVSVKIVLDAESVKKGAGRLAPGTSAVVEVDLRQGNPAGKAERT
jgi:membrane fusion protein (multidrug efflux system)